jgi:NAD(P)-dependent dehydrogenase (short-subunit alcohol dehydrogenase family)
VTEGRPPRSALITGGANGFGLATAQALLARGDRVTIGDIDRRQLEAARAALCEEDLRAVELDVTRPGVRGSVSISQSSVVSAFEGTVGLREQ